MGESFSNKPPIGAQNKKPPVKTVGGKTAINPAVVLAENEAESMSAPMIFNGRVVTDPQEQITLMLKEHMRCELHP